MAPHRRDLARDDRLLSRVFVIADVVGICPILLRGRPRIRRRIDRVLLTKGGSKVAGWRQASEVRRAISQRAIAHDENLEGPSRRLTCR